MDEKIRNAKPTIRNAKPIMKGTLLISLSFGVFACNNSADKKSLDNETAKNSLTHIDKNETNTNEYNCDFDKFLKDSKTPKLAKDIYLDNEWNLNNDNEALALLDSLTAKDKSSRQFYFKVLTKSVKKSDGYFSEELGNAGYEYVLNNTQEFASYFDNKQCHTEKDLATWADILIVEFGIVGEGEYDKPIISDYINKLKSNCKDCSTTQRETINKFGLTLNEKWKYFLKHIN